jgi:o-succinylbenzoate---CoA ligase
MSTFKLHDKAFSNDELLAFCRSRIDVAPAWEAEHFAFILNWLDTNDKIEISTSGSTGVPKKIMMSKHLMAQSARMTATYFELTASTKVLLCLPSAYIAGKMVIVRALTNGWNLHWVEPSSNPLKAIEQYFDFTSLTPMQVNGVLNESPEKFNLIKKILIGGAAISTELEQQLSDYTCECFETYGMTETVSHVAVRQLNTGISNFNALPGVHFTKDNDDCLVIHATHLDNLELKTNDVVDLQSPQSFRFLGRKDNVINSGGIKIFPELVEEKIKHLFKTEYYISSTKDNVLGQRVVLFIEGATPSEIELNALKDALKAELKGAEMPKELIWQERFERTISGKIKRQR